MKTINIIPELRDNIEDDRFVSNYIKKLLSEDPDLTINVSGQSEYIRSRIGNIIDKLMFTYDQTGNKINILLEDSPVVPPSEPARIDPVIVEPIVDLIEEPLNLSTDETPIEEEDVKEVSVEKITVIDETITPQRKRKGKL